MKRTSWDISAGAILLFALLYFFDSVGFVAALLPAALVHELGHMLALRLFRRKIVRVRIRAVGVELDYAPQAEGLGAAVCCLAGPVSGGLYALTAHALGGQFLQFSGAISLALSVFNCLPILPLDGGRTAAALLGESVARRLSICTALLLCACGAFVAARFGSIRLLLLAAWLLACNLPRSHVRKRLSEKACQFRKHGIE